jgi:hypothetical protein
METDWTTKLLEAIPADRYRLPPRPPGPIAGELAWHLAEVEGYTSHRRQQRGSHLRGSAAQHEAAREVKQLAPGFRQVHKDAVANLANLKESDLDS